MSTSTLSIARAGRHPLRVTLVAVLTLVLGIAGGGVAAAATAPTGPTSVSASTTGAGSAVLKWSPPASTGGSAITGYVVGRDGTDSNGTGAWSTTVAASARSQSFTLLVPGRTYTLSVRAKSAAGLGPAATVKVTTATVPGVPVVPAYVWPQSQSADAFAATITWAPPASDGGSRITGYRVSRAGYDTDGTGPWSTVVGPDVRSFTMTKLGWTSYTFTVEAINAVGAGPSASTLAPNTIPDYVHKPTITAVTSDPAAGTVTVTWDFLYYGNHAHMPDRVRVGRDGTDANGTGAWSSTVPVTSRSFTFTRLQRGSTYTFTIDAWLNYSPNDKRGDSVTVTL